MSTAEEALRAARERKIVEWREKVEQALAATPATGKPRKHVIEHDVESTGRVSHHSDECWCRAGKVKLKALVEERHEVWAGRENP